jgi:hypothetical protein
MATRTLNHQQGEDADLLINPSFELGETRPDGWSIFPGKVKGEYRWEEGGYRSPRCVAVAGSTNQYHGGWYQTVRLEAQALYRVRIYGKSRLTQGHAAVGVLEIEDEGGRIYSFPSGFLQGRSDWRAFVGYAVCPAKVRSATLYAVLLYGKGKAWADEGRLERIAPFVERREEEVFIGVQGGLFRFSSDGRLQIWGDGANGTTLGFSARVGKETWLEAYRFVHVEVRPYMREREAVRLVWALRRVKGRETTQGWRLEGEVEVRRVKDWVYLTVERRLVHQGPQAAEGYMFDHLGGTEVVLPEGKRMALEKWGGLPRADWYFLEQGRCRPEGEAYGVGLVPLRGTADRGPQHLNLFPEPARKRLDPGEALMMRYIVVLASRVTAMPRAREAIRSASRRGSGVSERREESRRKGGENGGG